MTRKLLSLSALLLLTVALATADTFQFAYAGNAGDTAYGTLTATNLGGGEFQVTAVSNGLYDGFSPVFGLNNYLGADNLLFFPANPAYLDGGGLGFDAQDGGKINIAFDGYSYELHANYGDFDAFGTFTLTAGSGVPEPSSILLLGTGLLGAASAFRRRLSA